LSYPGLASAFGIIIKKLSVVTTDENWQVKYIENEKQVHKKAILEGLSVFFNYSEKKEDVFAEYLRQKNNLQSFTNFAFKECTETNDRNRYITHFFSTEICFIHNKDPKKNKKPEIWASLKISGNSTDSLKNHFSLNIEVEQVSIVMKILEYIEMYSKSQTKLLANYQGTSFSKEQREAHKTVYQDYIYSMRSRDKRRQAEKRIQLAKMEEKLSLVAVERIRMATRLEIDFQLQKEEAKKEIEKMVKDFKYKKRNLFTSIKAYFGSSSANEEREDINYEVENYRQKLLEEHEERFTEERKNIDKKLNQLLSETTEFDVQSLLDPPSTYERFVFKFEFDRFPLTVSQGLSDSKSKKLLELSIAGISVNSNKIVVLFITIGADTEVWVYGREL